MPKTIPEISIETTLLYERLIKMQADEVISYKELSKLCGRNVQKEAYANCATARRKAERSGNFVIKVIPKVGLKRLHSFSEYDSLAQKELKHLRKRSSKAFRDYNTFQGYDDLKPEEKVKVLTTQTLLAFIHTSTGKNKQSKIEQVVQQTNQKLPYTKTLEAFR